MAKDDASASDKAASVDKDDASTSGKAISLAKDCALASDNSSLGGQEQCFCLR